jgi:hypothetical protein
MTVQANQGFGVSVFTTGSGSGGGSTTPGGGTSTVQYNNAGSFAGAAGITTDGTSLTVSGSTAGDLVRITQTGAGNAFVVEDSANPDATPFVIDALGSVGVGTSSPGAKIDAYNSGSASTVIRTRNDTTSVYLDANSGYSYLNTFTNHPMLFGTNNLERMRINNAGNVGIGTSSPSDKLQIEGNLYFGTASRTIYSGGSADLNLQVNTGAILFLRNNGSNESLRITNAGNVGIGVTSPTAKLDVQSTTSGVRFPNMTTTQKNAISGPQAGTIVFDTTLSKLSVYSGTAWETITSI